MSCTAASTIQVVLAEKTKFIEQTPILTMHLKDGDGAGTMPFLKSKKSVDGDHIFQYSMIPLKLTKVGENDEEVAWKNPVPNSARSLRPVYLIREEETDPDLLEFVIKNTDDSRNDLDWTELTKIKEGFKIDRTAADTRKILESVLEDVEIVRKLDCDLIMCVVLVGKEEHLQMESKVGGFSLTS